MSVGKNERLVITQSGSDLMMSTWSCYYGPLKTVWTLGVCFWTVTLQEDHWWAQRRREERRRRRRPSARCAKRSQSAETTPNPGVLRSGARR